MSFMSHINTMLIDMLGPFGPIIVLGLLGVVMILLTLPMFLVKKEDPLARLKARQSEAAAGRPKKERLRDSGKADKLEKYSTFLEPQSEQEFSAIRLKLMQAGYRSKTSVRIYYFAQFALGMGLLALGAIYTLYISAVSDPSTQKLVLSTILPAAAGYMLPKYWVTKRQQTRQDNITDGFPDSLDMMLVCVEAGQSLDQAILRVGQELRAGFPDLADEYDLVSYEMKAGKDKTTVLKDMAERCGVNDISSFVTVLVQSQQFGTSIADALRVFSDEMRDKRVMRAEEKANKLPTKMTLATMMLTVPPLLIILIGPSVYDIVVLLGNK